MRPLLVLILAASLSLPWSRNASASAKPSSTVSPAADQAFDYENEEISIVRLLPVVSLTATPRPKALSLLAPRTHFIDLIVASAWLVGH